MTPGQRERSERDFVIAAAAQSGLSERMLARVFGLPRSRVHTIVSEVRAAWEELRIHQEHARPTYREVYRVRADGRKRERSNCDW